MYIVHDYERCSLDILTVGGAVMQWPLCTSAGCPGILDTSCSLCSVGLGELGKTFPPDSVLVFGDGNSQGTSSSPCNIALGAEKYAEAVCFVAQLPSHNQ